MRNEITVFMAPKIYKAISLFISTGETRYNIMMVCLDISKEDQNVRIMATDGHCFAMYSLPFEAPNGIDHDEFILLPINMVMGNKKYSMHPLTWNETTVNYEGIQYPRPDGRFPDWRMLMPKEYSVSGELAFLNPLVIMKFYKACELVSGKNDTPVIWFNGPKNPAYITFSDQNFFGMIMSMKTHDERTMPVWNVKNPGSVCKSLVNET